MGCLMSGSLDTVGHPIGQVGGDGAYRTAAFTLSGVTGFFTGSNASLISKDFSLLIIPFWLSVDLRTLEISGLARVSFSTSFYVDIL